MKKTDGLEMGMRAAFGETMVKMAKNNKKLYVVDAGLYPSLGLTKFKRRFPNRFVEVGVAETNAAGVAAGIAKAGNTVYLATYGCFSPSINWNTIKQSIGYNRLDVKLVGSHAGLMTTDLGATHQALEDLALARVIPGLQVFCPIDAVETTKIMEAITYSHIPAYLRLVRQKTDIYYPNNLGFTIGKSHVLRAGREVTLLGHGPILGMAMKIKLTGVTVEVINCSSVKPLDEETILRSAEKTRRVVVVEDHSKVGGLGEAVAGVVAKSGLGLKFCQMGIDNRYGQSGKDFNTLYSHYGIGAQDIELAIKQILL